MTSDPLISLDNTETIKTLGLRWHAHEDNIHCVVYSKEIDIAITKHNYLILCG